MDELEELKQWAAKGYDVSLRYEATFDPPASLKFEWTCEIRVRSIGSVHYFPIPRAMGIHSTDPIEAIRGALKQAPMELPV